MTGLGHDLETPGLPGMGENLLGVANRKYSVPAAVQDQKRRVVFLKRVDIIEKTLRKKGLEIENRPGQFVPGCLDDGTERRLQDHPRHRALFHDLGGDCATRGFTIGDDPGGVRMQVISQVVIGGKPVRDQIAEARPTLAPAETLIVVYKDRAAALQESRDGKKPLGDVSGIAVGK